MTIAAILKRKGHDVASCDPGMPIAEVTRLLRDRRIGAVVVTDPGGRLMGILSERDIVRALAEHGAATLAMPAHALMTRDVTTANRQTSVAEAMAAMTGGRFRHLPVLEGGRIAGLVSIGDVVKARMEAQETEVDSLKAYVAGAA